MVLGALVDPLRGQHGLEDLLHDRLTQRLGGHIGAVLGGQDDSFDAHRLVVFITQRDLALGIRAQPFQLAGLAHLRLALHEPVGKRDGRGHQHIGLVGRVTEHQALVAGALLALVLAIHALGDIGRLFADDIHYAATGTVKPHLGRVVPDIQHDLANEGFHVDPRLGGDFSRHHDDTRLDESLARHTAANVLLEDRIQHRIRNLIRDFVGMALGDGLGRKQKVIGHWCCLS